jgi:hypothetical protein
MVHSLPAGVNSHVARCDDGALAGVAATGKTRVGGGAGQEGHVM